MKRIWALLALASPLAIAPLAFAADSDPDKSFYEKAAEGGLFEVDAGNQAQQKANSQKVKDFGQMMVKDHTAANDTLKNLAATKNITLPTSPSLSQMAAKTKLDALSGDAYDKAYIEGQIKAHEQTAALFKKEIASGQDSDAKTFAKDTLPTIQKHLKEARSIAAAAGWGTKKPPSG